MVLAVNLKEGQFAGWTSIKSLGPFVSRPPTNGSRLAFSCELRKAIDRASPALLQSCGSGEPSRRVSLLYVLAQPVATQYRITLDGVLPSEVSQTTSDQAVLAVSGFVSDGVSAGGKPGSAHAGQGIVESLANFSRAFWRHRGNQPGQMPRLRGRDGHELPTTSATTFRA